MATLYKENWPLFWTPNANDINGDPKGLLRADNLTQDEDGSLNLIRGTKKISSGAFPSLVYQIFSKTINLANIAAGYPLTAKVRYIVYGTSVLRNYSPSNKSETIFDHGIISGGGDQGAAFGYGFGHIFIIYGTQKVKDDGINQSPIGMIAASGAPGLTVLGPPLVAMRGPNVNYIEFQAWENDTVFNNSSNYVEIDSHPDTNRAIALGGQFVFVNFDGNALNGIANTGTSEDIFQVAVRVGDTNKLISVKIEYLLQPPILPNYNPDATDYYSMEWSANDIIKFFVEPIPPDELNWKDRLTFIENARKEFESTEPIQRRSAFNSGINVWSTLVCKRSDFIRTGTDDSLNWSNIRGIRYTFLTTEQQTFVFSAPQFIGGSNGPLDGDYAYLQVDVQNNGFYTEKSLPSGVTATTTAIKAAINVQPTTVNPKANECWIFRASNKTGGFYRIKKLAGANGFTPAPFNDIYSDVDALRDNIRLDDFQANVPNGVIGMVCNFKGRNWYITYEAIYPSYRDNFSSYDTRYVLETSGNTEFNLFLCKLNNDTLILATNNDFYEITGTAGVITSGDVELFDVQIRTMGIKSPSISKEFSVREGNLFYRASDGIRILSGSSCQLLSNQIDLLFRNFNCHGISPSINDFLGLYYIGISKNQLYYSFQQQDNKRALYVYSFSDQKWRYEEHGNTDSISAMFVEEDDVIVYSTAQFGDRFLRQLDTGTLFDETNSVPFKFLTIYDHNNQPRNRKDSYTLKITADTGNVAVNVILKAYKDSKNVVTYTTTAAFDGRTEKYFSIYSDIGLVKYYQLEINGTVPVCKIYNFSIDYEPRPEQLTNLRLAPNNFGIAGRKRIPEIPMVIDTLGNAITFTPIIDGVAQTASTIVTNDKAVYHYWFTTDKLGFDISGLFSGGLFEFYELLPPKEIELVPDPLLYKLVSNNNLGSGSRKRFIQYALVIDTRGTNVTLTPYIDGVAYASQIVNTIFKKTVIYTFDVFATGVDISCTLISASSITGFEFYGINEQECVSEKLPPLANKLHISNTNFNTSGRKRIIQFAFTIDTLGATVIFTPIVDGISFPSQNYVTTRKQTVIYTFDNYVTGIDMGGMLSAASGDFEYYGINLEESITEKLPALANKFHIPYTNFNTSARKRISQFAFTIDTLGTSVTFTPVVDGISYTSQTYNTFRKETVIYTFDNQTVGIDIGGLLSGIGDFEFYGVNLEESIYEKLPGLAIALHIPFTNFNTSSRKRISQFAFVIDTRGNSVTFTPSVDGNFYTAQNYVTTRKQTVIYTFATPVIGVDLGGLLNGTGDFEYYGANLEESIYEKLPSKVQALTIPNTNYGVAAKKRIRTIPMVIDTFGNSVVYTPRIDGINFPTSIFVTTEKTTVLHYFLNTGNGTPFGIDYGGTLTCDNGDFEFYELLKPENVETLPVGKRFDQFGPLEYTRLGKVRRIILRILATGTVLNYKIFNNDVALINGMITTLPEIDKSYEISLPKGVNLQVFRMEIDSPNIFHRFEATFWYNLEGNETANKKIVVK